MIQVDKSSEIPLYKQVYDSLRRDILGGVWKPGEKIPSIRNLMRDLGVSRNTVANACQQLFAEGYIESRHGAGYFVSDISFDILRRPGADTPNAIRLEKPEPDRGRRFACDFSYGNLHPDVFPMNTWRKLTVAALGEGNAERMASYGDYRGEVGLRYEIARYLERSRGVSCSVEQIMLTSGVQQSVERLLKLFDPVCDGFAMEDPGFQGVRTVARDAGFSITTFPSDAAAALGHSASGASLARVSGEAASGGFARVPGVAAPGGPACASGVAEPGAPAQPSGATMQGDADCARVSATTAQGGPARAAGAAAVAGGASKADGISADGVTAGSAAGGSAGSWLDVLAQRPFKIAYVTPSNQMPMGTYQTLDERTRLLELALSKDAYILEDDYDSIYRFNTLPIPTLRSLDRWGRVIYMGTFSKIVSPALRIGYMVLPQPLLARYMAHFERYRCTVPWLEQETLRLFMEQGHLERHVRRIELDVRARHDLLVAELARAMPKSVEVLGSDSGLHLLLRAHNGMDQEELVASAEAAGVRVAGTRRYWADPSAAPDDLVMLGYASARREEIPVGVRLLRDAWFA